jgi:hypothetical protein
LSHKGDFALAMNILCPPIGMARMTAEFIYGDSYTRTRIGTNIGLNLALGIFIGKVGGTNSNVAETGSRGLWKLTDDGASVIKRHSEFGKIFKSKSDGLWWADDNAGHGGSKFKVFNETNKGLEWFKDADEFGDFIINKHKGSKGKFIPWGQLKTIK